MYYSLLTVAVQGLQAQIIRVESDINRGMPLLEIVGLPDASVREAKERMRSAICNSGFEYPDSRMIINLAPADSRKEGSGYDLPMALAILAATRQITVRERWRNWFFLGELRLDGEIRGVPGVLPACSVLQTGEGGMFVPGSNMAEAAIAGREGQIIAVNSLRQLTEILAGSIQPEYVKASDDFFAGDALPSSESDHVDFSEVKGQYKAKRALEIAAAGGHNLLLSGPPGAGKSMLIKCLPGIMPPLTRVEALEIMQIRSVMGLLNNKKHLSIERPLRAPHHTATRISMLGGGNSPKPGEISLAHNGVLFLDEMAEFKKEVLNSLRQPLEEGVIQISRQRGSVVYPARFILAGALNPCPCGYYGYDHIRRCQCTEYEIRRYQAKISGPVMDRIDMHVACMPVPYKDLHDPGSAENSAGIRERVAAARERQLNRYARYAEGTVKANDENEDNCMPVFMNNAHLTRPQLMEFCRLDRTGQDLLHEAYECLHLSVRSNDRLLKVARTIADLADSDNIEAEHLAEAIQFRCMEK